jgi:predicted amino acid dehydrogenase
MTGRDLKHVTYAIIGTLGIIAIAAAAFFLMGVGAQ